MTKSKPVAVLISDIHYNINTLPIADAALRQAKQKSECLQIPLIIAGDLHDTKANLRAECMNAIIETLNRLPLSCEAPPVYLLIGNHDKINEKSIDHSLFFLDPFVTLVEYAIAYDLERRGGDYVHLLPYFSDTDRLKQYLKDIPKGSIVIMHQGIKGSNSGEYIQDRTAITKEDVAGLRVISGHYHRRQTLELPDGGKWDYIGNPFTLNFGEAGDPEKGFQVLYDDGSLEFIPTNLRKHVVIEQNIESLTPVDVSPEDILCVKIKGPKNALSLLSKSEIASKLQLQQSFRLDLIPTEENIAITEEQKKLSNPDMLDALVDELRTDESTKYRIKQLWKTLVK